MIEDFKARIQWCENKKQLIDELQLLYRIRTQETCSECGKCTPEVQTKIRILRKRILNLIWKWIWMQ